MALSIGDGDGGVGTAELVPVPALARSASLSPTERVVPTWTDPTARRAADLIGGPLGRHALVGRTESSPRCGSAC